MILGISIVVILAALDIGIKCYMEQSDSKEASICNGKIILRKTHNHGAVLNLFEKHPLVVRISSSFSAIYLCIAYLQTFRKKQSIFEKLGLGLMLAGGTSNLYDRLTKGFVIDYFSFNTKFQKLKNIVFNIGDMFIFLGGIVLFIVAITKKNSHKK